MIDVSFVDFGINTDHPPDMVVDRPHGMRNARAYTAPGVHSVIGDVRRLSACYLVTCFRTPFFYLTANGLEEGLPGDCVVHDPVSPQRHGPAPGSAQGFRNDWIHIYGGGISRLLEAYGIPLNVRIPTGQSNMITGYLQNIAREAYSHQPFWRHAAAGHIAAMLLKIGRCHLLNVEPSNLTIAERALLPKFVEIRMRLRGEHRENWNVRSMAELACLSPSRFSVLYRKFFGSSPAEDLMERRLEHATYLLSGTDSSISEISNACGFSSQHYFSRLFRKRTGSTPSAYARTERVRAIGQDSPPDDEC